MYKKLQVERKPTGWRLPVALRDRLVSWAKGESRKAEDVAAEWLEDRLLIEERKKVNSLGKPIRTR